MLNRLTIIFREVPILSGKKLIAFISVAFAIVNSSFKANAQELDVQLNSSHYDNGYNVSCHGTTNGSIEAIPVNGNSPYAFQWSNGSTTQDIANLAAGTYTLTVVDFNNETVTREITLTEPDAVTVLLHPDVYAGGTNISQAGASDGRVTSEPGGGAPPYSFLWSTGLHEEILPGVPAGTYTLTVADANGCTASAGVTLTEPTPLHIVSITSPLHNGKNISCREGDDGSIELTVAGGIAPYTFQWNNGSFDEDPQNLTAGIYMVRVTDRNRSLVEGQITLTEPLSLRATLAVSQYGNYNISTYGGSNGYINSNVTGGITPYSYSWTPFGQTTANISNLGPGDYHLTVTDANNCITENNASLIQPNFSGWSQDGNAGSNPANQFIGTTDAQDLSFRTNNVERMKIGSGGTVGISGDLNIQHSLFFNSNRSISHQDAQGSDPEIFSFGSSPITGVGTINPCVLPLLTSQLNYQFNGMIQLYGTPASGEPMNVMNVGFDGYNAIIDATGTAVDPDANRLLINYYCGHDVFVGNDGSGDLTANHNFYTNGKVGIGTSSPSEKLQIGDKFTFCDLGNQVIGSNFHYNGDDIRLVDGPSSAIYFGTLGDLSFRTAISGNANDHIDWTEGLKIANNGNIGIGIAPSTAKLDVGGQVAINNNKLSFSGPGDAFHTAQFISGQGVTFIDNEGITLKLGTASDKIVFFNPDGKVGIGTFGPSEKLEVDGSITTNSHPIYLKGAGDHNHGLGYYSSYNGSDIDGPLLFGFTGGALGTNQSGTENIALNWTSTGQVGIAGAICDDYKLAVHGKIIAEEVVVKPQSSWPDYVFKSDYDLKSLQQLNEYIKENKHLPGIPSEKEIESSGIGIGEITGKQMEKIEELTLYILQLKTEIDDLKKENKEIKQKIYNK